VFCFYPLHPPLIHQFAVQFLEIHGTQLFQRNLADIRSNVIIDVAPVGLVRRRPDLDFAHILEPFLHPLGNHVLALFGEVPFLTLCQRFFQFFLNLGLRFSQHIFENLLAGDGVMPSRVPSLPATILSLADIALTVASSFRHLRSLLISDTHYHRKGKIAIHEIYQRFSTIFDLSRH